MKNVTGVYPSLDVDTTGTQVVSNAGTMLLTETITRVGLDHALSAALSRWRLRLATHDPAKVLLDLALGLAIGGDCLADVAVLRAEPGVSGLVASDPRVSRTIDRLTGDAGHRRGRHPGHRIPSVAVLGDRRSRAVLGRAVLGRLGPAEP